MEHSQNKILIVEDERIVAEDLRLLLRGLGYVVTGACASGPAAIESALQNPPDAILMDINLEGTMDGIETALSIQSIRSIPVIFLTAYADEATLERASGVARYGYVMKPFEEREIFLSVEIAIHKHANEEAVLNGASDASVSIRATGSVPDYPRRITSLPMSTDDVARRQSEMKIRQYGKELRELIRHKDRLFGILSEDRASPKNMLLHYCERLLAAIPEGQQGNPVHESIAPSAVDGVWSDPEEDSASRYISLMRENILTSVIIQEVVSWLHVVFQTKDIRFKLPSEAFRIHTNLNLFRFVLRHTMLTGCEMAPTGSTIELQLRVVDDAVEFAVRHPFTPATREHVDAGFVPRQQTTSHTSDLVLQQYPALARSGQIMHRIGGMFNIEEAAGNTLRILFSLPLTDPES